MTHKLVRDLMTVGVPTCRTTSLVLDVARYLVEKNLEEMVVLNDEGEGVGVCGMDQLVLLMGHENLDTLTAEEVMTEGVPSLPADLPAAAAAQVMRDQGLRSAYMLHNSAGIIYPAGFITLRHLLRALAAQSDEELKDLGISAQRESPIETFIRRRDEARRKAGLR